MKIVFVCSGVNKNRERLQPWRYILEVAEGLSKRGHDVSLISINSGKMAQPTSYNLNTVYIEGPSFINKKKILKAIDNFQPDLAIIQIGATTFLMRYLIRRINCVKVGLWMGTRYGLREIFNVGVVNLFHEFYPSITMLVGAVIPLRLTLKILVKEFTSIVTLNNNNMRWIISASNSGIPVFSIPPGIDDCWKTLSISNPPIKGPYAELLPPATTITYMGGASELRGPGILVKSIALLSDLNINLVLLLRESDGAANPNISRLLQTISSEGMDRRTVTKIGFLDKEVLIDHLEKSDIIALPFRVVQADTPLSIIECMSLGKTIISTKTDGIPELLEDGRGYAVEPNDTIALSNTIREIIENKIPLSSNLHAREYLDAYPSWIDIVDEWSRLIERAFNER
jgi:phosphatidyl-myo-inositol dimannoside synthase